VLPLVVGVCALVLAVMVGLLLLDGDPEDDPAADPSSPASSSSESEQAAGPTEESLTSFVEDYLQTVDDDPPTAFDLLTPDYQAESGGLGGYENFWGNVSNVRVESVTADVEALTVTYTYSYNLQASGKVSDTVRMQLEESGDSYLIADAVTIG
jgi:hypothetical protein